MADGYRLRDDLCAAAGQEPDDGPGINSAAPHRRPGAANATLSVHDELRELNHATIFATCGEPTGWLKEFVLTPYMGDRLVPDSDELKERMLKYLNYMQDILTAGMLESYVTDPDNYGGVLFTPQRLSSFMQELDGHGIDLHLHAGGRPCDQEYSRRRRAGAGRAGTAFGNRGHAESPVLGRRQ